MWSGRGMDFARSIAAGMVWSVRMVVVVVVAFSDGLREDLCRGSHGAWVTMEAVSGSTSIQSRSRDQGALP